MPRKKSTAPVKKKAICSDCVYWRGWSDFSSCCNYILDTGAMRGCESGQNCTRFRPQKKPKKKH